MSKISLSVKQWPYIIILRIKSKGFEQEIISFARNLKIPIAICANTRYNTLKWWNVCQSGVKWWFSTFSTEFSTMGWGFPQKEVTGTYAVWPL